MSFDPWNEIYSLVKEKFPSISKPKFIGSGNWGKIYKVEYLGKELALRIEIKRDTDLLLVYKEMKHISNPHVLKIYDYAETEKYIFVLTEYIDGFDLNNLSSYIVKSENPTAEKIKIVKGILKGMNFLFQNGIYHRDIKLENIRVRKDGNPVIIDFGSVCINDKYLETMCYTRKGNYMSRPFIKKTPINDKYYYSQSIDSTTAICDPKIKKLIVKKNISGLKNSYTKNMLEDADIWGVILCIFFVENIPDDKIYKNGLKLYFKMLKERDMFPELPITENCIFKKSSSYEDIKINWEKYMNDNQNLFYPVYQAYLKTNSISKMIKSLNNDCFKWLENPTINPDTSRSIKKNGPTYNSLKKKCSKTKILTCIDSKCSSPLKTKSGICNFKSKFLKNGKCFCGIHIK